MEFDVHIQIDNPSDAEIMLSAAIINRQLQLCGLRVLVNEKSHGAGLPVSILIDSHSLKIGEVALFAAPLKKALKVNLEDTVEKTLELISELKRS